MLMAQLLQIFLDLWSINLEPLSIISVIFQLASTAPNIDKILSGNEKKIYTRTEAIEIYRANMKVGFKENTAHKYK